MDRKISVSVAMAITLIAMAVTVAITFVFAQQVFNTNISATTQRQALNNKVSDLDKYVRGNYFGEIDDTYLADAAARGYIAGLQDPNCVYYSESEYNELLEIQDGTRVEVGIEVIREPSGFFQVIKVYPESPADAAGVEENMLITHLDDVDVRTYTTLRAVQTRLRGLEGTTLRLACRNIENEEVSFDIQRIRYTPPTIEPLKMVDGFAYVRINSFGATSFADFDYIIREAQNQGAMGFVFDVRGNADGSYEEAYKMIDLVCPLGTIARGEYKNGTTRVLATSDEENKVEQPMVVLVNGGTSGAAELFALCIRDLASGQIVGEQTMGRGMLQAAPFRLSDGSAVVVTSARLLTDKGEAWDGVGVTPEVLVTVSDEYERGFYNIDPRSDPPVIRATDLVRSMAASNYDVSGGGSITPGSSSGGQSDASDLPDSTPPPDEDDLSGSGDGDSGSASDGDGDNSSSGNSSSGSSSSDSSSSGNSPLGN